MLNRRAILTYHSLDDSGSVISVRPQTLANQISALAASGVTVVRLAELASAPAPAVALTFDDGFENFASVAAPVLARHQFPATIFLVTGYCGRSNDWPSQLRNIPRLPLLSWSTIQDLSGDGLFDFGAHTVSHRNLAQLNESGVREEILSSKRRIEDAIGRAVVSFAYPYGAMPELARRVVRENFGCGCSTQLGYVTPEGPREALPRLDVYYLSMPYLFTHLFGPAARWYLGLRGMLRDWRGA